MNVTIEKPIKGVIRRRSKYQFIFDRLHEITSGKALLITGEKGDNMLSCSHALRAHFRRTEQNGKYAILVRDGKRLQIQLKKA